MLIISVKVGEKVHFNIGARRVTATDGLGSLSREQRKCNFPSDNEGMTVLKRYSKRGCQFECMLEQARELCNCTPWNYPVIPGKLKSPHVL